MEQFMAGLLLLLRDPNVVTGICAVLLVIFIFVFAELWRHIRASERLSKYAKAIQYAKDRAEDMFLYIQTANLDMSAVKVGDKVIDYTEKELNSVDKYGYNVDARMLYVLDDAEIFVFNKFGIKIEFDDIIPRAQSWFVKWYAAYLKIISEQPATVEAQSGPGFEIEIEVDAKRSAAQKARREAERKRKLAEEGNPPVIAAAPVVTVVEPVTVEVPATGELAQVHKGEAVLPVKETSIFP